MAYGYHEVTGEAPQPTLIRWSAIFGGLVLGLALVLLLSALWLALAYGSDVGEIASNIEWYIGLSAVASLFIGGLLTGYLSGVHGAGTGMVHGFALWGLLIVLTITIGIPSVLNVFGLQQVAGDAIDGRLIQTGDEGALWASFWTIAGGFVAAGLGGMIGGAATGRASTRVVTAPPVAVAQPASPAASATTRTTPVVVSESTADDDADERTTTLRR
jgi:hypothetical protein